MNQKNHLFTLWILIITTAIITILTFIYKDSAYQNYLVDYANEPLLTILMQGTGDRIFPWNSPALLSSVDITSNKNNEEEIDTEEIEVVEETVEIVTQNENLIENATQSEENIIETEKVYSFTNGTLSYFDNALFIGDSRTVGLQSYSNLKNASFYAKVSSTIFGIMDDPMIPNSDNTNISIRTSLKNHQFEKIYIMIGVNELGTGNADTFCEQYAKVIHDIRELQPSALIFIQSIMHVTTEKSKQDKNINNKNIDDRNEKIKELANNHDIFYLDINEVLDDDSKGLNPDYTFDSVHLKASQYSIWEEFLLSNCIDVDSEDSSQN